MDRQYRSDPKYAEEIISTLWPNKQLRRECLQFLLNSIRFAHRQGPSSWGVTLFENLIRLNVGQIAVLSLWTEEAHVYCLATPHLPKQSGIRLDTDWSHFAAIPEPTEVYRVATTLLNTCPKALREAHFSLIRIAATRKPHSPFKRSFSDGILAYLEKEFDTSIDRPTYLDSRVSEPTPSGTTGLEANGMRSFYTHYWSSTVLRPDATGSPCSHTAGSGFNKRGITTGDRIYIVTVSQGRLYLIGAFTVAGPPISYDEACQRLPYNPWEAPEHLIAQPGSETPISYSRAISLETARHLRYYSPEGEKALKFISENAIDNQTLRGVRRLNAASARMLEASFTFTLTEEEFNEDFERQLQKSFKDGDEIRRKRLENAPKIPEKVQMIKTDFKRNSDVAAEAMKRAIGFCEACGKPAPFIRASNGTPYLEIHHKRSLSDGGEDTVENTIALCPNCHREMHFGVK